MESSAGVWEGDGGGGRGRGRWGCGEECVEADGGATKQVLVPQARRGLCVRASGSVKPKQPEYETERVAFAWLALPREGSGLGNI